MNTEVSHLTTELKAAEADAALWDRLQSAPERAAELAERLELAVAEQERREASARKEAAEARLRHFKSIAVADITKTDGGLLHRLYKITWKAESWSTWAGQNIAQQHSAVGFHALAPDVLSYLIEKHPEQIPAAIMELAPGKPYDAFDEYFAARQRGYTRGGGKA